MDAKGYKNHRRRISHAVAKIDNEPPAFDASAYYKSRHLNYDARRVKELDRENMELLKGMNIISRLGSKIDCWTQNVTYKSNFDTQGIENLAITRANRSLLKRIGEVVSEYSAAEFIKSWKDMQEKSRFATGQTRKRASRHSKAEARDCLMFKNLSLLPNTNPSARTRCFFEIGVKETKQKLGRIVFELYDDVVPRKCANFAAFCRKSETNGLSYKGTSIHRIVPGYWCQGGVLAKSNSTVGTSILGRNFDKENFSLLHACPGVLSTCTGDDTSNDSKFNLTFKRLESMDGKKVVFGRTVYGLPNVHKIEEFGTKTGKPIKTVTIFECGVLTSMRDPSAKTKKNPGEKTNSAR